MVLKHVSNMVFILTASVLALPLYRVPWKNRAKNQLDIVSILNNKNQQNHITPTKSNILIEIEMLKMYSLLPQNIHNTSKSKIVMFETKRKWRDETLEVVLQCLIEFHYFFSRYKLHDIPNRRHHKGFL